MRLPVQKNIVRVLWFLAIAGTIGQGLFLPNWEIVAPGNRAWPVAPFFSVCFGLLVPPVLILMNVVTERLRPSPVGGGFIITRVDEVFGAGWSREFLRLLKPMLLVAACSFLLGATGIVSALLQGSQGSALALASFFLASGIGFSIARCIGLRLLPHEPWA